jgi:uncharacterized protein (TIRG00374 family)
MPSVRITRGRVLATVVFVIVAIAFLYLGLPKLVGLGATIKRLRNGNGWWLALAAVLEVASFGGYIALFRTVFLRESTRIGWKVSYEITLAGLVATRLLAAAGAGGVALTAWALRRSGMPPRTVGSRMVTFMALVYGVYMATLVIDGLGLYAGLWPGSAPFAITVIPAIFGGVVILLVAAVSLLPGDAEKLVGRWTDHPRHRRLAALARRVAVVPAAAASGIRGAIALIRGRELGLLGAIGNWGFDIACLWACFHAFGNSPHTGVVVMAYFVGWLANLLPLPGGIGGVEGGLIGSFSAFGLPVGETVVAVLSYRAFSFWLPIIPGGVAYLQLRRTVARWREDGVKEGVDEVAESDEAPSYH